MEYSSHTAAAWQGGCVVIEYNDWNFWCKGPIGKSRCNGRCLWLLFPGRVGRCSGGMGWAGWRYCDVDGVGVGVYGSAGAWLPV